MKPVLTFVLGALLASAIAVFMVKRDDAPPPAPASQPVATAPIDPPAAAPEQPAPTAVAPEPVVPPPSTRALPRRQERELADVRQPSRRNSAPPQRQEPTFSSSTTAGSTQPQSTAPQQQQQAPTTSSTPSNPLSTTINMPPPPPPGESRSVAEDKPAAPARVPKTVTIPAGTLVAVRVDQRLASDTAQTGDSFRATLDQPLVVDGAVIAERGARVEGRVAESDSGGRVRGRASIVLELVRLNTSDGQRVRLATESFTRSAERSTKKDAAKVGIGAGLGAAIGAIAGGGKGAAIGATVGGAAGTGAVLTSRGDAAEIPAETRMTFRLSEPITITEKLR
jgi:hypothetical protein